MPLGINVFSFSLFGSTRRETAGSAEAEPDRGADRQRATASEPHDIRHNENPLEHQAIFQSGFFPIY